jgi:hypothetical protein
MTKSKKQILIDAISYDLIASEKMWEGGTSHAMIIGYLQGALKNIRRELESK